jgi:hypothetical protein
VALIYVAIIGFRSGNPSKLAAPFDSNGNQCGYDLYESYPYIFPTTLISDPTSINYTCVKTCPDGGAIDCA